MAGRSDHVNLCELWVCLAVLSLFLFQGFQGCGRECAFVVLFTRNSRHRPDHVPRASDTVATDVQITVNPGLTKQWQGLAGFTIQAT